VVREHIQCPTVLTAEKNVVRALRSCYCVEKFSLRGVNEDLAGGNINLPVAVLGKALTALLDEWGYFGKRAIGI
jgi:hypothetical protein